ncbi:uncharacterized protein LOC134700490 isoform X2 [Mytilus trossulus]|uniref:uncharacterized protein LOC134700490 isoform X2 n=1 Tax=Mytilus trossulus TaxID=6551 RepID=UPI00300731F5
MKTWNQDYPIKFIQLEKCLQEKKKELPIISLNEIKHISTKRINPLNHEELMLYLNFHHDLRALVYFEDIPDYIILDTQWLSDAFKCIITAEKFQSSARRHLFTDEWNDLNIRGILHSVVLDQILETNKKIFKFEEKQILFQHKDHILKVMEKFDIIIRPTVSDRDDTDTKPCYYIPCMVKEVPDCPINEQFNVTEKNCTKSTWLCFKFKFLPGHLMNHLIASLSRKYEIAEVPVCGQKKRPIALFRGTVVFKLQKTSKLLVKRYPNVIQIQVWDFGKHCNIDRCLFKDIDDFVTGEINTIIRKRFKMTTVKFDKMLGCSLAEPDCVTGFYEQDADYFCDICTETHISEWSDDEPIQNTGIYEKKPKQTGLVLIVNFMFSGRAKERRGSDKDVNELTHFFRKELDYQKGIKTEDEHISVMEITKPFKNKPGGKFNGKPRLFLIQACRGKQIQEKVDVSNTLDQTSEHDECPEYSQSRSGTSSSSDDDCYTDGSTDIPKVPKDADIIVAFATTPGYKASRHPKLGSRFIRAFLDVARRKYKDFDVEDILRDVRQKLAENLEYEGKSGKCQMGIVESTSRKKFFF